MRITRIAAHRVELPLHGGRYRLSGGKTVEVFGPIVLRISPPLAIAPPS